MSKNELPHRRFNPLTEEWVLVSPQRDQRPWLGQIEKVAIERLPAYDPHCYLCPGNERAGGRRNEEYSGTYVFDNDFPALLKNTSSDQFTDFRISIWSSDARTSIWSVPGGLLLTQA